MYIYQRNEAYYFRLRTSNAVSQITGLSEIRQSLKTSHRRTAQKLALYINYKLDIIFRKLIQRGCVVADIQKIKTIIRNYIQEAIQEYSELETKRHNALRYTDENGKIFQGHTSKAIEHEITSLCEIISEYEPQFLKEKAQSILPRTNISNDDLQSLSDEERAIFYPELLKGETEILHYDKQRNEKRISGGELLKIQEDEATANAVAKAISLYNAPLPPAYPQPPKAINLFSEKMPIYIENEFVSRGWRPKTKGKILHILTMALEIMGDKSLHEYTRADFENFRKILQTLPSNLAKKEELKNKPLIEIAKENAISKQYKNLTTSSINTLIGQLHTFLEWCKVNGYIQSNLTAKLKMKDKRKKIKDRNIFDDDDIETIISKIIVPSIPKLFQRHPERLWMTLIGFYSGMRIEEIAQLHIEDIYQTKKTNIWVFDLNENINTEGEEDKKIKNLPSVRVIPIHPKLIEFGFLDYYEKTKAQGHERVFHQLKKGRDGYGRGMGDWFNREIKRHIEEPFKKSFHSTRHTFSQQLKDLSVDEHKLNALVGHGEETISYNQYGSEYSPEVLLPELIKVQYPQFDEFFGLLNSEVSN